MVVPRMVLREIYHRPASFAAGALWIALAVAACLTLAALHEAAGRETARVQRDIGFNLRIIPATADVDQFLLTGFPDATMPEEVVHRLAEQQTVAYNHLVATLHGKIEVDGKTLVVTGLSETLFPPGQKKPPMSPTIEPGTAHLGHQVALRLDVKKGGRVSLGSYTAEVVRVAPSSGTQDDLRIWLALKDAQQILNKDGQINEIQAIDCLCLEPEANPKQLIAAEVAKLAPESQLVMLEKIATARARQRRMTENLANAVVPIVVVAGMFGLGVLAWLNVRQRLTEIGLLRVLGHSSATIAGLVFGKALLWGLVGAVVGVVLGVALAQWWVVQLFPVTGTKFATDYGQVCLAVIVTPLVACVAAALAASLAVVQEPAIVLREE